MPYEPTIWVDDSEPDITADRLNHIETGIQEVTERVDLGISTGGGDLTYVHVQGSLSDTWVVVHNLAKYPSIEVVNSGNNIIIPDVTYDSIDQLTLTFGVEMSGKAFVN